MTQIQAIPVNTKATTARNVYSSLYFLEEADLYKSEKPYLIAFGPEDHECPTTNIVAKEAADVLIRDIRPQLDTISFDVNGFTVTHVDSFPSIAEMQETTPRKSYFASVEQAMKKDFGADRVQVIGHLLRKRDAMFPFATGEAYKHHQPIRIVHVDWTPRSIRDKIAAALGDRASQVLDKSTRNILASAWKPLNGTGRDWPLALCDATTFDPQNDLEPSDIVKAHGQEEKCQVYERERYRWHFLSDQRADEVLLFRAYDSKAAVHEGIPHGSFYDPAAAENEVPRESIELHVLMWWK
ncbi:MAG: hypothetical protein M1820_004110 [Bogoriella megaspora]|nr:MAG: hypothetical protein M1820_004110 [Bogoriella megaspora]